MMRLDCRCDLQQATKQTMSLRQTLLVRCLVVYLGGTSYCVPIKPKVTTQQAKKTGYEFRMVEITEAETGSTWAAMYDVRGEFPKELKAVTYFMSPTLNDQDAS